MYHTIPSSTVVAYAEGIGSQSDRAHTKPSPRRPAIADQHAVAELHSYMNVGGVDVVGLALARTSAMWLGGRVAG